MSWQHENPVIPECRVDGKWKPAFRLRSDAPPGRGTVERRSSLPRRLRVSHAKLVIRRRAQASSSHRELRPRTRSRPLDAAPGWV